LIARNWLRDIIIEKNGVADSASVDEYDFKVGFLMLPIINSNAKKHIISSTDIRAHRVFVRGSISSA